MSNLTAPAKVRCVYGQQNGFKRRRLEAGTGRLGVASPLVFVGLCLAVNSAVAAPAETVNYDFSDSLYATGAGPSSGLVAGKSGLFYGTTGGGGSSQAGTVFQLAPPAKGQTAWAGTVLYSFTVHGAGGDGPIGSVLLDKTGNIFSASWGGNVVELMPPAKGTSSWAATTLYSFAAFGDDPGGVAPSSNLVENSAGSLFGTTAVGGTAGLGTFFELDPPAAGSTAWTETVVHNFQNNGDGGLPESPLVQTKSGSVRGTAGGGVGGYEFLPPTRTRPNWKQKVLYAGCSSQSGLIADKSGALYGASDCSGDGEVYKLTRPASGKGPWTYKVLFQFSDDANGDSPYGGLTLDKAGSLYGTTYYGGIAPNVSGSGTVFKLTNTGIGPTGWTLTTLYTFTGGNDGGNPNYNLLLDKSGDIFGVATHGGAHGTGAIFKITP